MTTYNKIQGSLVGLIFLTALSASAASSSWEFELIDLLSQDANRRVDCGDGERAVGDFIEKKSGPIETLSAGPRRQVNALTAGAYQLEFTVVRGPRGSGPRLSPDSLICRKLY